MSVEVDALPDMLARLKLTAMRDRLDGLLDEAARGDFSLRETLALLCRAEVSHREERRIQMGTGIAKFTPTMPTCTRLVKSRAVSPSRV